jgi:hypothetical protein
MCSVVLLYVGRRVKHWFIRGFIFFGAAARHRAQREFFSPGAVLVAVPRDGVVALRVVPVAEEVAAENAAEHN